MKIMVAFLGKKKNGRDFYLNQIKNIQKNNILNKKIKTTKDSSYKKISNNNIINFKKEKNNKIIYNEFNNNRIKRNRNRNRRNEVNIHEDNYFYTSLKLTFAFSFLIGFLIYGNTNIMKSIVKFCTNVRQAENLNINSDKVLSTMSLFNKDNYIFARENKENNNEEENNDNINESQEYKVIDEQLDQIDIEEVYNNKDVNVNIHSETTTLQKVQINDMWIMNYSSNRNIDYKSILDGNINLTKKSDKILLYNTHTSESYTNSDSYKFEYSSVMRSQDARFNMLAIAKELNNNLLKKGFISVQDTTPHDYGAYTGAYMKSRESVQNDLNKMGGAGIIIDVHRDAMEDLTFRPVANIKGIQVSQLMFVVGVGNENWEDNLRLALKLQQIANKVYPGLFRQMILRDSTYNQDLNKYSLLIEFGATGNTIDEVKLSTRCLSNLLNIIYKD